MQRAPTLRRASTARQPSVRKVVAKSGPVVTVTQVQPARPLCTRRAIDPAPGADPPRTLSHHEYLEALQAQLDAARSAQDWWYASALPSEDERARNAARLAEIAAERDRYMAEEQQRRDEQQRQAEILRHARETAAAEERRLEARRQQQQEEEMVRAQVAEIERLEAEAELARAAEAARVAAEQLAAQIRAAEEEERRRIEAEEREWAEVEEVVRQAERAEEAAAAAEEQRLREEADRRDCAVCMERFNMQDMIRAPCLHFYCTDDMRDAVNGASSSRSVFRCCGQVVPADDSIRRIVSDEQFRRYRDLVQEQTTQNPVYCSNAQCAGFIPPAQAQGPDRMQCQQCRTVTCRHCKGAAHDGECRADEAAQAARRLAEQRGWKACPSCKNMVEKASGCMHMTCRCGMRFCYRCGRPRTTCRDRCGSIYD